jgi:hypothetical protein
MAFLFNPGVIAGRREIPLPYYGFPAGKSPAVKRGLVRAGRQLAGNPQFHDLNPGSAVTEICGRVSWRLAAGPSPDGARRAGGREE